MFRILRGLEYRPTGSAVPIAEATARASGADDILMSAQVIGTLEEAIADCALVVGASARLRTISWPTLDPKACAERMIDVAESDQVALVMGRERTGLTNAELEHCHYLVHIPANPNFSSLNLSQAVQVLAYEIRMAQLEGVRYLACKTSADLFELEQDDFLEGVEIMLAEDFMKQAVHSELHMVF